MTLSPGQALTTGLSMVGKGGEQADGVLLLLLLCLQNVNFSLNQNAKIKNGLLILECTKRIQSGRVWSWC